LRRPQLTKLFPANLAWPQRYQRNKALPSYTLKGPVVQTKAAVPMRLLCSSQLAFTCLRSGKVRL
ncbi:hypothetical protein, partial [Pseudomonas sp.]|uniref:hypothetical protein n=1 Tax=Pseudomonas sp. TaxID=306 RepID=UPI0023532DE6